MYITTGLTSGECRRCGKARERGQYSRADKRIECYSELATDMEPGHWVTGSMGHLGHLSRPGHRVIILTRCETRVFPVFEKKSPR